MWCMNVQNYLKYVAQYHKTVKWWYFSLVRCYSFYVSIFGIESNIFGTIHHDWLWKSFNIYCFSSSIELHFIWSVAFPLTSFYLIVLFLTIPKCQFMWLFKNVSVWREWAIKFFFSLSLSLSVISQLHAALFKINCFKSIWNCKISPETNGNDFIDIRSI